MGTALRLLLWSYGSRVVLMLPQQQLALVLICMTLRIHALPIPSYRGVPIWYYARIEKQQMLQIVTRLLQFYKINWTISDGFEYDDFLNVMVEEIEAF